MADTSLYGKFQDPGKKVVKKSKVTEAIFVQFLSKKIMVRIHYPSGEVKEHEAKVTMHYFDIDDMAYVIYPDAFYREGKKYYIDYFYGNPKPIVFKYDATGIVVPSMKLKKELMLGNYLDENKKVISPETFEALPYKKKVQFPGVYEIDSIMFNRILTQKASEDLWGKPESMFQNKKVVLILLVLAALGVSAFMVWRQFGG